MKHIDEFLLLQCVRNNSGGVVIFKLSVRQYFQLLQYVISKVFKIPQTTSLQTHNTRYLCGASFTEHLIISFVSSACT